MKGYVIIVFGCSGGGTAGSFCVFSRPNGQPFGSLNEAWIYGDLNHGKSQQWIVVDLHKEEEMTGKNREALTRILIAESRETKPC